VITRLQDYSIIWNAEFEIMICAELLRVRGKRPSVLHIKIYQIDC
jgi:hypothetical protein